jgi:hypothetical protein
MRDTDRPDLAYRRGLGESVAMVGMIGWAIGLMGQARSGRVMSLVGIGMYGAFAAGGPLGLALLNRLGFAGLMVACTALPLVGLVAIHRLPAMAVSGSPFGGSSGVSGVRALPLDCRASALRRSAPSSPSISSAAGGPMPVSA